MRMRILRRKFHQFHHFPHWNHRKKISCSWWVLVIILVLSIPCMLTVLHENLCVNGDIDETKITPGRASINHSNTESIDLYSDQMTKTSHNSHNQNSPPTHEDLDTTWVRISDDVHIYSAHLDTRYSSPKGPLNSSSYTLIRIIGLIKVPPMRQVIRDEGPMKWLRIKDEFDISSKYYCKIFFPHPETKQFVSYEGSILTRSIIEEGIKVFAAAFFNCYINASIIKASISTTIDEMYVAMYPVNVTGYPDKIIHVETKIIFPSGLGSPITEEKKALPGVSACIRPLFGPMVNLSRLIEFVSYYSHMGVTSFNFYDLSISPEVRKYLVRDLVKLWRVNVSLRKWNLPSGNTSELWDYGSLASLNDCLYRNMESEHVLFIDIDEFIVPQLKNHKNLYDVISHSSRFHELRIRNTFFCEEFCSIDNNTSKHSLRLFSCCIRTKRIWSVNLRTKFIVKPKNVVTVGHHMVTSFAPQKVEDPLYLLKYSKVASKDLALMNHYRECSSLGNTKPSVLNRHSIRDTAILQHIRVMKVLLPSTTHV